MPLGFIISLNLKRRHLSESQRAMVASKLANLEEGRPKETAQIQAVSQSDAARMLNVSRASVQTARRVQESAAPELITAVETGEVSVSAAADIATLTAGEQIALLQKNNPKALLNAAKEIRATKAVVRREERLDRIAEISKGNAELAIDAAEIRIRAERRIGELMAGQREAGLLANGGDAMKARVAAGPEVAAEAPITLAEVGIDKNLADRARKFAAIPETEFEGDSWDQPSLRMVHPSTIRSDFDDYSKHAERRGRTRQDPRDRRTAHRKRPRGGADPGDGRVYAHHLRCGDGSLGGSGGGN